MLDRRGGPKWGAYGTGGGRDTANMQTQSTKEKSGDESGRKISLVKKKALIDRTRESRLK